MIDSIDDFPEESLIVLNDVVLDNMAPDTRIAAIQAWLYRYHIPHRWEPLRDDGVLVLCDEEDFRTFRARWPQEQT